MQLTAKNVENLLLSDFDGHSVDESMDDYKLDNVSLIKYKFKWGIIMVELRGFKVNSLEVENRAVPGTELKLQNQVKYNVNYMDGERSVSAFWNFVCLMPTINRLMLKLMQLPNFHTVRMMKNRKFTPLLLTSCFLL